MNPQGQNVHWILSPARLPVPPSGQRSVIRHIRTKKRNTLIPPPVSVLRAENGTRTRDPDLGKVVLYQLSYFRISSVVGAKIRIFSNQQEKIQKKPLPCPQVLFDLIQLIQGFHRGKVINIQAHEFIPDLLKHRIIELEETHLETFPVLRQGGNRL